MFQNALRDRVACYQNERQPLKVCFSFFYFLELFQETLLDLSVYQVVVITQILIYGGLWIDLLNCFIRAL